MNMKHATLLSSIVSAMVLGIASLPASAQTATPNLDRREAGQQQRIQQGVQSGQLNARETARLERRQQHLAAHEAQAKADGVVTPGERARLQREAHRNSREIHREKHDRQTARK